MATGEPPLASTQTELITTLPTELRGCRTNAISDTVVGWPLDHTQHTTHPAIRSEDTYFRVRTINDNCGYGPPPLHAEDKSSTVHPCRLIVPWVDRAPTPFPSDRVTWRNRESLHAQEATPPRVSTLVVTRRLRTKTHHTPGDHVTWDYRETLHGGATPSMST